MDDFSVIVNNPDIRSVGNFFANTFPGRPLREITYLLDYSFFGLDPRGYHVQNIFWHALNCWLLYRVVIRLDLGVKIAWLSSFLFLVHPIHVEVVANSSHRKDSLALAFMLMTLLSYMNIFEQKSTLRRFYWLAASIALWITAFFAKGNSLVFPAIAIAYEYTLVPEENRLIVRRKQMVPFFCISFLLGLIAWYFYISTLPSFRMDIMGAFIKTENLASFSVPAYILMVLKSFAFMFSKLLLPLNLSMEYIYAVPDSFFNIWVISAFMLLVAFLMLVFRWEKTSPHLLFLLVSCAILWLPTANILWPLSYFAADRYMYAPSAVLCVMAVLVTEHTISVVKRYYVLGWICILSVCAILTWKQSAVWDNETGLYSQMLKVSPRSLEAMIGLSNVYYTQKEYDRSARYARNAIERDFTDYRPYMIMGNISFVHNRPEEALELFLESREKSPQSPEVYNSLGSVYDELGDPDRAVESFKTALMLRPGYFQANTNLGVTYERMNRYAEAESALTRALAANGDHVPAWFNLGVVRYKNNDRLGARAAFLEAVRRDPAHMDALTNLSIVCKESGDDQCYNDAVRRMAAIAPGAAGNLLQR